MAERTRRLSQDPGDNNGLGVRGLRLLLATLRRYVASSWFRRGKGRVMVLQDVILGKFDNILAVSSDGRRFLLELPDDRYRTIIAKIGYCEKNTTRLFESIIRPDDVVFDIGANIGWYTTLFGRAANHCHAFEPASSVFKRLQVNCQLNHLDASKVTLNNEALADTVGIAELYAFADLHHGHSSLSDLGRPDARSMAVNVTTLSEYVSAHDVDKIDLIKMDVEGAEMAVLKGSAAILGREAPPVWCLELNREASDAFGYEPRELLSFLEPYGYEFYRIDTSLQRVDLAAPCPNGVNILCAVPRIHDDRLGAPGLLVS